MCRARSAPDVVRTMVVRGDAGTLARSSVYGSCMSVLVLGVRVLVAGMQAVLRVRLEVQWTVVCHARPRRKRRLLIDCHGLLRWMSIAGARC